VLVSSAAVVLKPMQLRNVELARKARILEVAGLMEPGRPVEELFRACSRDSSTSIRASSATRSMRRPSTSILPRGIRPSASQSRHGRTSRHRPPGQIRARVPGRVRRALETIVLPVHGYGLWSTMYGFLALSGDGKTVRG
jgi:Na+-transporting NADH:ubiquinone oxidoreductase subunit C